MTQILLPHTRPSARIARGFAAACLAGCATVVPPASLPVVHQISIRPLPLVVDKRLDTAKVYREDTSGSTYKFFADDTFKPPVIELVRQRPGDALPEPFRNETVELQRMDVGFEITPASPRGAALPSYFPPGAGAGPVAIGTLLGRGIIYAIRRARADEWGIAYLTLMIDGQEARGTGVALIKDQKAEQSVQEALDVALNQLAEQVGALNRAGPDPATTGTPVKPRAP